MIKQRGSIVCCNPCCKVFQKLTAVITVITLACDPASALCVTFHTTRGFKFKSLCFVMVCVCPNMLPLHRRSNHRSDDTPQSSRAPVAPLFTHPTPPAHRSACPANPVPVALPRVSVASMNVQVNINVNVHVIVRVSTMHACAAVHANADVYLYFIMYMYHGYLYIMYTFVVYIIYKNSICVCI